MKPHVYETKPQEFDICLAEFSLSSSLICPHSSLSFTFYFLFILLSFLLAVSPPSTSMSPPHLPHILSSSVYL